jgi:hypothetical protein
MSYKEKYLKYKLKYLNLKNNLTGGIKPDQQPKKKILLMFLGGTPTQSNQSNIIKHYREMNTEFLSKDNYYVVVHPMILTDFVVDPLFNELFSHVLVVNEQHHLKTAWGTKSLSDATLLMMQYAHQHYGKQFDKYMLFDKYILLSSTCCPLYTFDEIYRVLSLDDKSWLNGSQLDPSGNITDEYRINKDTISFSQWMILDKQHVKYFFMSYHNYEIDGKIELIFTNMYKKTKETICIDKKNKIINNIVFDYLIKNAKLMKVFKLFKECDSSDEFFFGIYIFINLCQENLNFGINFDNPDFINIFLRHLHNMTLDDIKLNLKHISKQFLQDVHTQNIKNLLDITYLYPISFGKIYNHVNVNVKSDDVDKLDTVTIENVNINFYQFNLKTSDNPDTILLQSTYCNWFEFNTDPANFLREFPFSNPKFRYDPNFLNNTNFKDINKRFRKIFKKKCIKLKNTDFKFFNEVLNVVSHPVEYSCWTFTNILNAFLLAVYFICSIKIPETEDKEERRRKSFITIFYAYQQLLFKLLNLDEKLKLNIDEFDITNKETYKKLYNEKSKPLFKNIQEAIKLNPSILNKKFGNPITPNVLLAAISQGSLFIRKCLNTSMIETYSHILKRNKYKSRKNDDEQLNDLTVNSDEKYNFYSYSGY